MTDRREQRTEDEARSLELGLAAEELGRVHRLTVARLLREAVAIVAPRGMSSCGTEPVAACPLAPVSLRGWRRRARQALKLSLTDGQRFEGTGLLSRLLSRQIADWPAVVDLARAARRAQDGEIARLLVGWAALVAGDAMHARRAYVSLLARGAKLRDPWRALEGLAEAQCRLGRLDLALEAIDLAAEDHRSGETVLVEGLRLALLAGDVARARRAAARLDMLIDPFSPAFAAAVGRQRERSRISDRPRPSSRLAEALLLELARERCSASGRVARALI